MPQDKDTKLQCTLTGYQAWLYQQLQARRGLKKHDIARRAWEEWIENHEAKLAGWGLSADDWTRLTGGKLADIETQRRRRGRVPGKRQEQKNDEAKGGGE